MTPGASRIQSVRVSRADWAVLALLTLSLATNATLAIALYRFSSRLGPERGAPAASTLPLGTKLPAFDALRYGGQRETLTFGAGERPLLVYVFTPKCQWCARNLQNAQTVLEAALKSHRVVALSLDPDVAAYIPKLPADVPVYVQPTPAVVESYHLGATPTTLIIGQDGELLRSWLGAYSGSIKTEVESYFQLSLPGLVRLVDSNTLNGGTGQ